MTKSNQSTCLGCIQIRTDRLSAIFYAVLISFCLSGCGSFSFPGVFKIDVAQGNVVTQEMVDLLKPGLEKQQVLYVMGSPLVEDLFNANRWDYIYYFRPGGKDEKKYHVALFFEGEILAYVEVGEAEIKQWHNE